MPKRSLIVNNTGKALNSNVEIAGRETGAPPGHLARFMMERSRTKPIPAKMLDSTCRPVHLLKAGIEDEFVQAMSADVANASRSS